jgi:hypothetical protein
LLEFLAELAPEHGILDRREETQFVNGLER